MTRSFPRTRAAAALYSTAYNLDEPDWSEVDALRLKLAEAFAGDTSEASK